MADLTTLAAVKAHENITGTERDALISKLITEVSMGIDNYCNRPLMSAARTDVRNGHGGNTMLLRDFPVSSVSSVVIDGRTIPSSAWSLVDRSVVLDGYTFTRGRLNVRIDYVAGYATPPADIELSCIETILMCMKRFSHMDVSSKSLAGETVSFIVTDLPPSAKQRLNNYRLVSPM